MPLIRIREKRKTKQRQRIIDEKGFRVIPSSPHNKDDDAAYYAQVEDSPGHGDRSFSGLSG
jgi:hypothetical protein